MAIRIVDLNTEMARATSTTNRDFARKIVAYHEFFQRPSQSVPSLYERKYGTPKRRVLIVTTAEARLKSEGTLRRAWGE